MFSSSKFNSLFRRFVKILDFSCFIFSFPEFQVFLHYIVAKLHLNHRKASTCVFNFSFVWSFFYYRISSWRLYMMVHQGFNSFSKYSSRFFSKELNYSSSCIMKCNSFYIIFWSGVMPFAIISLHVSWFTSCPEWHILNPSFSIRLWDPCNPSVSSLELSWVIFHLKLSLRIVAISGACKWSKFFIYPTDEISFSSPCSYQSKSIVSISGRISPHNFGMFSISPHQACPFRCWFSNKSVRAFS